MIPKKLSQYAGAVEEELQMILSPGDTDYRKLTEAMSYAVLGGGKRIRGTLVLSVAELFGTEIKKVLPFACAIEMIHAYSLVHDDLPCMDNDDMRRGKPSCHIAYGEWMALLAGDALLTKAFETISCASTLSSEEKVKGISLLSKACGADGMIAGQVLDLMPCDRESNRDSVLEHIRKVNENKTGKMLLAAVMLGCIGSGASEENCNVLASFGTYIGEAFQIADDILDVVGEEEVLGKPVGSDAENEKINYVTVCGLAAAESRVEYLTQNALDLLDHIDGDTSFLKELTRYLAIRKK